jgi:hypothetical protein
VGKPEGRRPLGGRGGEDRDLAPNGTSTPG